MKKFLLVILSSIMILTGCSFYYEGGKENIRPPEKLYYGLDGLWELDRVENPDEDEDMLAWTKAMFRENILYIGNLYGEHISYSIKNVDTRDYLLYKHRTTPEALGLADDRVDVVNIYDGKDFITEIIKTSDREFIYPKGDEFLVYRLRDREIDKEDIYAYINSEESLSLDIEKLDSRGNIGIILGIKKLDTSDPTRPVYKYRTDYIKIRDEGDIRKYSGDSILLPRRSGFYKVEVRPRNQETDEILVESLDRPMDRHLLETSYIKNILYIGNDYMSVENIGGQGQKNLRLYPMDYLSDDSYRVLEDILDEASMERVRLDIGASRDEGLRENFDTSNFGLRRKKGYWTMFGRIDYGLGPKNQYRDFNIRAVTPKTLVNYDELPILWNVIELRVPNIVDGFVSPKKDFLLARMKSSIDIYSIYNGKIGPKPIYTTSIGEDEEIIMAEWATNLYAEKWIEYFK